MVGDPLLSIVIANYNYGGFLGEAIKSVLRQNCQDVELIVIDGGSTDNSVDVIKQYSSQIAYWVSEPDHGQSEAFNKGFAKARGRYLTWLNADDLLAPGAVSAILLEVKKHPECDWFTGNFVRFLHDSSKVIEIGWGPHVYPKWMQRKNSPIVVFGPSSIFSKDLWERSGRIDESLHFMMDMEMWMRFIVAGVKQRRILHFIWAFRMHAESKTAEYGEHRMDQGKMEKFNAEADRVYASTGYCPSKMWRFIGLFWRIFDGSLWRRFCLIRSVRMLSDLDGMSELQLLEHKTGRYFKFQGWFCDALKARNVPVIADVKIPSKFRAIMGRIFGFAIGRPRKRLLVCGCHRIESCAWPWNYGHEIVPVMWDLWPANYASFQRFTRRNRVRQVFCTSRQSTRWVNENCPGTNATWLPEAVSVRGLPMGSPLTSRTIDVLTYGRPFEPLYGEVAIWAKSNGYIYQHGAGDTFDNLTSTVRNAKIVLCYPLCDTNPQKAQGVETLTQRYWEAMCSGAVIVGRVPQELIDICGYNPVVEAGDDLLQTLDEVLKNLPKHQELVDKNRKTAELVGDWSVRMDGVLDTLKKMEVRI